MKAILVVNAGSSSLKFQIFTIGDGDELERRIKGQMDGIGPRPRLRAQAADGTRLIVGGLGTPLYVWDLRLIRTQLKELGLDCCPMC